MRVEDKGAYWEVDGGTFNFRKSAKAEIFCSMDYFLSEYGGETPPFLFDLRDSLMDELT
jgi:hypothetical protein